MKKSERGGQGGQGKAKIAQKKGHLTQKRPKIADEGVLEPPKHPRNKYINDILYLLYIIYIILYILYHILYIIYHISYTFQHFLSPFLGDFWTSDVSYTPWTPNIILFEPLIVIFNHLGGFGLVFRFLKNEPFLSGGIFPFPTLLTRYRQSEFARFFELCFGHSRWPQTTYYPIQYMLRT